MHVAVALGHIVTNKTMLPTRTVLCALILHVCTGASPYHKRISWSRVAGVSSFGQSEVQRQIVDHVRMLIFQVHGVAGVRIMCGHIIFRCCNLEQFVQLCKKLGIFVLTVVGVRL